MPECGTLETTTRDLKTPLRCVLCGDNDAAAAVQDAVR